MARLVSKIYGEALYDFATSEGQLEKMCEEALDIVEVFESTNDLKEYLANPKIKTNDKVSFIREFFVNKVWTASTATNTRIFKVDITKGENPKILDFLSIVINKGRQKDIVAMLKYFVHLTLSDKNIGEASVVSASELSDEKKKLLHDKLVSTTKYERFIVDYKVDKGLIAGLKVKVDDKVLDKTYKTKIFDISKNLRGLKL